MIACSTCSGHGLNGERNANIARDITVEVKGLLDEIYSYHMISSQHY